MLAGTGDFARVHAHFVLRKEHRICFPERLKRACLLCAVEATNVNAGTAIPLDSEWHMVFGCTATASALATYRATIYEEFSEVFLPWEPTVGTLASHVLCGRQFPDLLPAFMKCVSSSFSLRFKALSRISPSRVRELLDGIEGV